MLRLLSLSLLLLIVNGQEEARRVLYGLPPLPDDPTTTQAPPPTIRPRVFRFGPLLNVLQPPPHPAPLPPPALPHHHGLHLPLPTLGGNPFDNYHNINVIPELPPRPENKLNGYYDLDGNFVPYGNEQNLPAGQPRPKRSPMSQEDLNLRLLEEEYAYDDEIAEPKVQNAGTTKGPAPKTNTKATKASPKPTNRVQMISHDTDSLEAPKIKTVPKRSRSKAVINQNTTKKPLNVHPRFLPQPPKARTPVQRPRQVLKTAPQPQAYYPQQVAAPQQTVTAPQHQVQAAYYPPQNQQYSQPPQYRQPQYQQYPQPLPPVQYAAPSAEARPVAADNRDPQVIAYLKEVEDYDWDFKGERPDLSPGAVQVTTPETLVALDGRSDRSLVGTTQPPYSPATFPTARYGPGVATSAPARPQAYTSSPHDLLGIFGGTPHPILSGFGQLFSGFPGLGGRRK
ncbi:unnamed protein product [Bursaphelenchus okinawaensis]|uniref:Uncharacterized protein n=1 Tax=Bursaphelenchus okinawaensis TaxID=465554 RepID=A0A811LMM6_9BILA|nr:unnamed protein product [Bursaphelenchus okinawaensis]CAG9124197.1 unnamed protein product [Bursaphelenchus okinawaensis]